MRTTITLDDELIESARAITGIREVSTLVKNAMTDYVQREAGRRLAKLGGTMPNIQDARRRRPWNEDPEA